MRESRICLGVYRYFILCNEEMGQKQENQEYLYSWGKLGWKMVKVHLPSFLGHRFNTSCPQDPSFRMMCQPCLCSDRFVSKFTAPTCPKEELIDLDQLCSKPMTFRVLYNHILDTMFDLIFILGSVQLPQSSKDSCPFARCDPKLQLVKKHLWRCGFLQWISKL